jgi:hypothetical protein
MGKDALVNERNMLLSELVHILKHSSKQCKISKAYVTCGQDKEEIKERGDERSAAGSSAPASICSLDHSLHAR